MLTILPLTGERAKDYNQIDSRFLAGDKVQLRVTRKGFLPDYASRSTAEWLTVKPCPLTADVLLANPVYATYLAYVDGALAGQMILCKGAHQLCEVLDIRTDSRFRRQGVATALINMAQDWAKQKKLSGLRIEATDEQSVACQFLESCQFELGGVDRLWHFADPDQTNRMPAMRRTVLVFYYFST